MATVNEIDANSVITEADVIAALKADKGDTAILVTYKLEDLERQGHNFGSKLTRVILKYKIAKCKNIEDNSYVVKLYQTSDVAAQKVLKSFFDAEINFYQDILPQLNDRLEALRERVLRVPGTYNYVQREESAMIFMEDLSSDFKVHDSKNGLDEAHVDLIVRELARLHVSSKLFFKKESLTQRQLEQRYPVLQGRRDNDGPLCTTVMREFINTFAEICRPLGSYDFLTSYLDRIYAEKNEKGDYKFGEDWSSIIDKTETTFTIRHGNCSTDNLMFKYSESGVPEDIRLLDFQLVGRGSPVLDLLNILYPCVDTKLRQAKTSDFISAYFDTFKSITEKVKIPVPLNLEKFTKEYENKWLFGFAMAVTLVPVSFVDPVHAPDVVLMLTDETSRSRVLENYLEEVGSLAREHVNFRPRLLDMFDSLFEQGVFNEK